LEDEIADYEHRTGRRPPAERHRQETFSGYTLAIVDSVTKLTRYLRDCEIQLKSEVMIREQLTQDVVQFRALVDALTTVSFTQYTHSWCENCCSLFSIEFLRRSNLTSGIFDRFDFSVSDANCIESCLRSLAEFTFVGLCTFCILFSFD